MAKFYLPKKELTEELLNRLIEQFKLSDLNIEEIKYWMTPSPFKGIIFDTDPKSQYLCYPDTYNQELFFIENPEATLII